MIGSLLFALLGCRGAPEPASTAPAPAAVEAPAPSLPPTSSAVGLPDSPLYDLQVQLEDQEGQKVGLDVWRGHPTVLTMFYATCKAACPMLVSKMRGVEAGLSPAARDAIRVLMISFDPERDTPELLRATAAEQHLDLQRWRLVRPAPSDVRLLSALLGVKFNRLSNGDFNHSSVLVLIDRDGRPVARLGTLSDDPAPFLAAAEALVATPR